LGKVRVVADWCFKQVRAKKITKEKRSSGDWGPKEDFVSDTGARGKDLVNL